MRPIIAVLGTDAFLIKVSVIPHAAPIDTVAEANQYLFTYSYYEAKLHYVELQKKS